MSTKNAGISLMMAVFDQIEVCERENDALRTLLHRKGLSDATIRRKVAAILKEKRDFETALHQLKRVTEEALKRLPGYDLEAALAAMPLTGKPH